MKKKRAAAGTDVAKEFSKVCIMTPDMQVFKTLHVTHNKLEDFEKLFVLLDQVKEDFGCSTTVVLEATGHYHKILLRALVKRNIEVVVINPIQSDSIRNLNIRKVKNDKVDAKKLAALFHLKEGDFQVVTQVDTEIDALKDLVRQYYAYQDEITVHKLRLGSFVDRVMLGYDKILPLTSVSGLAVLKAYPSPRALLRARKSTLLRLLRESARKGPTWAETKYEGLIALARIMVELGEPGLHLIEMIRREIAQIEYIQGLCDQIVADIKALINESRRSDISDLAQVIDLLDSIPGIGILAAATLVAEFGDLDAFRSAQAMTAYAGIDPNVVQSGKFKGTRVRISKRGSRFLRRVLFHIASANIRKLRNGTYSNPPMKDYYERKCENKPKMVALVAVMHKMIYIIFAVLRDRKSFELRDPKKHAATLMGKVA